MIEMILIVLPFIFGALLGSLFGAQVRQYMEEIEGMFGRLGAVTSIVTSIITAIEIIILYMPTFNPMPPEGIPNLLQNIDWMLLNLYILLFYNNIALILTAMISYIASTTLNLIRE